MAANAKKKYPDLRYKLIRGLVNYEKLQRKAHYLKQAAEWTSKAVVSLEFTFDEIKSVRQATQLQGIGDTIAGKLREISKDKRIPTNRPAHGKFISAAPALLVALYMQQEHIGGNDILQVTKTLVPEMQLRTAAKLLTEEAFVDKEGFCQATWRLHVLVNRGLIKKRTRDKLPVYELLPPGEALAKQLMASVGLQGASLSHISNGLVPDMPALPAVGAQAHVPDHLYTNDDDSDGVVLYVDTREWGGDRLGLINLCQRLAGDGIRYATCHLTTGDYGWSLKSQGRKVELPFLIERKRVDDLAHSVVDGRYIRQKEKMMTWKRKYTDLHQEAKLYYVVEGAAETYVARCADGCGGVGRCGNPDVYEIEALIRELNASSEFSLILTQDKGATTDFLVIMTRELQMRIRNGEFDDLLGHAETLNLDMNYSKGGAAAKRGGKASKAAKKVKAEAGEGTSTAHLPTQRGGSSDGQVERPKIQRKRKTKAPIMDIEGCIPGVYDPHDGQNQRYNVGMDFPTLVRPSDLWSTGPATSSDPGREEHVLLSHQERSILSFEVDQKLSIPKAAAGTSNNFSDDVVWLPLEPKCPKTEVPRKRIKGRKVHEITWSDDEEDLTHLTSATSLSHDSNSTPDNKRWHASSLGSASSTVSNQDGSVMRTEPAGASVTLKEERWSAELQSILGVLPNANKNLARSHLDTHAGNVEAVLSALFDVEGDVTHLTSTTPLSDEDSNSTPDNNWWHAGSLGSASSTLSNQERPVVKAEEAGLHGSPIKTELGDAFKTELDIRNYPTSPVIKQEVSGTLKEERWSAELQSILVVLPNADKNLARRHLDTHAGNVEAAMSALFEDEEDLTHHTSTTSLSDEGTNSTPDNKRWHASSIGSASSTVSNHSVKPKLGDGSPLSSTGSGVHEFTFKTEPELRDYPTSPIVNREASGALNEDRWSAELQSLLVVLPNADKDLARSHLDTHAGNVEAALSDLLEYA